MRFAHDYKRIPLYIGMLLVFALIPVWYRFPGSAARGMGDFSLFYSAGFLLFWPMAWTLLWWVINRFDGIGAVWRLHTIRYWLVTALLFGGWILLSWVWSYKRTSYPSVAISAALPSITVILVSIVMVCIQFPKRWIFIALAVGLLWCSVIACLQVANQASLGLRVLGEFQVDPAVSGTVVVQADGIRWLRPYGLLPHPNMLAGFLVMGLIATYALMFSRKSRWWLVWICIYLFGFWALLLTFSRSAWLGLAAGLLVFVMGTFQMSWGIRELRIRTWLSIGTMMVMLGIFVVIYQPFLFARTGLSEESIEMRSTSDRAVYTQIALDAIKASPVLGTGIGNFSWYAAAYLAETPFDLRGQPVHNIYLLAWSELGIVGLGLFAAAIVLAFRTGIGHLKRTTHRASSDTFYSTASMSIMVTFLVIGLFDHYFWTLIQFQIAFWGMMAVSVQPPSITDTH